MVTQESKLDSELRLSSAIERHQRWQNKRKESERARADMVLALHDAHVSGFTYQELADFLGVSRQRVGQYLEGETL